MEKGSELVKQSTLYHLRVTGNAAREDIFLAEKWGHSISEEQRPWRLTALTLCDPEQLQV
jgi:hypothetical protein